MSALLNREVLTKRLVSHLTNEIAVGGIGWNNFALWTAGHRPENFYMLGSMGLTIPIAMGLAIAQPARKVIALEGDGSLLMELGNLATVGANQNANLIIVLWDNEAYQITGGQPTHTSKSTDLVAVARACGIASSRWAATAEAFDEAVTSALSTPGPHFIGVKIDSTKPSKTTPRDAIIIRDRFMTGIGVRPAIM